MMIFTSGNILLLGAVLVFAKKLHLDLPPEPEKAFEYIVPDGQLELHEGDVLLFISSTEHTLE